METNYEFKIKPETPEIIKRTEDSVVLNTMLMYEGLHEDCHGNKLDATDKIIYDLSADYSDYLRNPYPEHSSVSNMFKGLFNKKVAPKYQNVSLNHDKSDVRTIVGKVLKLYTQEHDGKPYLFGHIKIMGKDNVAKVLPDEDGISLWDSMSISFGMDEMTGKTRLKEVSYVFSEAIKGARSFSAKPEKKETSFEMSEKLYELSSLQEERKRLTSELNKWRSLQELSYSFGAMVKRGDISRLDKKRLMVDAGRLDPASYTAVIRMAKTIAQSKKASRNRFNYSFGAEAFSGFVDNVVRQVGGRMSGTREIDPKQAAEAIFGSIKSDLKEGKETKFDMSSALPASVESSGEMKKEVHTEENHVEGPHTIKFGEKDFSEHDLSRMMDYANAGDGAGMIEFMKSFGKCESSEEGKDHDMGKDEHDLKEKVMDCSAKVEKLDETITKLTTAIFDLQAKKEESSNDNSTK
jgi:hypothetical protein